MQLLYLKNPILSKERQDECSHGKSRSLRTQIPYFTKPGFVHFIIYELFDKADGRKFYGGRLKR